MSRARAKKFRKNLANAEVNLWSRLRLHPRMKFRRQHPIGPYIADFACVSVRLVIEVDGETHSSDDELQHGAVRDAFMRKRGWRIVRVWNNDVYKALNSVLDKIDFEARAPSVALRAPPPP